MTTSLENGVRFGQMVHIPLPIKESLPTPGEVLDIIATAKDSEDTGTAALARGWTSSGVASVIRNCVLERTHPHLFFDGLLEGRPLYHSCEEELNVNPNLPKFHQGVIAAPFSLTDIPRQYIEALDPVVLRGNQSKIELWHEGKNGFWYLCDDAENKMRDAINDSAVVLVSKAFLFIAISKPTVFCVRNCATEAGTFVAGNFYSPTTPGLKQELYEAYDNRKAEIVLPDGSWAIMRPCADERIVLSAKERALSLPYEALPVEINGLPRKTYREMDEETFDPGE
jgi:hypothetical protein